jgi:pimeloyl-ACP methyl ester carboxylesterase
MIRLNSIWLTIIIAFTSDVAVQTRADTPPQARYLRVNDVNLSYIEQGTGAPVVFVHGAISDLRFWEPQRPEIAKHHRFIAYTYRYHGVAPWPDDGSRYSVALHAADLAAFIRGLGAGPVHLVGQSYGGLLATLVASEHPQLLRSLTLAEPALGALLASAPEAKLALEDRNKMMESIAAAVRTGGALQATKLLFDWVNNEGPDSFDKQSEALRQMFLDNANTVPLFQASPPPPAISCATLGAVKLPTLVIGGEHSRPYYSLINEIVARCTPGSRMVIMPKATHPMNYQNPAAFNEALLQFLAQQ